MRINSFVAAVISLVSVNSLTFAAERTDAKYWPVPIYCDGVLRSSGFYLHISESEIGDTLEAGRKRFAEGSPEMAVIKILDAVIQGDKSAFLKKCVASPDGNLEKMFDALRLGIKDARATKLIRAFHFGDASIVAVSGGRETAAPIITFLMERSGSNYVCAYRDLQHPIFQVVSTLARAIQSDPTTFKPADTPGACDHAIALAPLFGGENDEPVSFHFSGESGQNRFEIDAALTPANPGNEKAVDNPAQSLNALAFYFASLKFLASGDIDKFADRLGPKSRKKFQAFTADPAKRDQLSEIAARPHRVAYVLCSDQVKIIIYQFLPGPWSGDGIVYDTIYTPSKAGAIIVNFAQLGPFDTLLHWKPVYSQLQQIASDKPR